MISVQELRTRIARALFVVDGDFRQKEIGARWEEVLSPVCVAMFSVAEVYIACSSGTYVRSIAHDLGKKLGTRALALRIVRTKVGDMWIENSLSLTRTFFKDRISDTFILGEQT